MGMGTEEPARVVGWGVSCVFVLEAAVGEDVERKVGSCTGWTAESSAALSRR